MSWLATVFIALVTGAVACVGAGFVANLGVGWYHITSREGASGYFVIGMAILGMFAGIGIGAVTSRVVAAGPNPGFWKGLGVSVAVPIVLLAIIAGVARLLADVPPEIAGQELWLSVEVRYPPSRTTSPAEDPAEAALSIGALSGRKLRTSRKGVLWKEDARLEEGRWIVPGAAPVFTSRGKRMLDVTLDGKREGFLVPLPRHPGKESLAWSDWLPRPRADGGPAVNTLTYRYKVIRDSEPVRVQTIGPFEVATIAGAFYDVNVGNRWTLGAASRFAIRHRGQPVVFGGAASDPGGAGRRFETAEAAVTVQAPRPALLVRGEANDGSGAVYLLEDDAGALRATYVSSTIGIRELTNDPARFAGAHLREQPRGWLDRVTLDHEGVFLVGSAVLDTRRLAVRRFEYDDKLTMIPAVPPLALSPDERSIAFFASTGYPDSRHVIAVTDTVERRTYALPVDRARMRYAKLEKLDPAWLDHHYAWQRDAQGVDRLVERPGFTPLPYRGELSGGTSYPEYRLEPAGEALRKELVEFLVREMHAERLPAEPDAYALPLRIDGQVVNVNRSGDFGYVSVSMETGAADASLVARIAERFDAELATGRHDAAFVK